MPGKHVRFADAWPETPSPSFSVSSLPSTAGPYTPPSAGYHNPLPVKPSGSYTLHPILQMSPSPLLDCDISMAPTTIKPRDPKIPVQVLALPATEPPIAYMEVVSPYIPWRIAVPPSVPGTAVTVGDVLFGIYQSLRQQVLPTEFDLIPSEQTRKCVYDAYLHRCKRASTPQAAETESKKGLKRIDFFMDNNAFLGLSTTKLGGHIWQMHTRR